MSVATKRGVGMKKGPYVLPGQERAGMDPRVAAWLARSVCVLSLALAGAGLLLLAANRIYLGVPVFEEWVEDTVIAVGFSTVGAVIAPRFPPRNPIGWLFCALGLVAAVLLFCGEYAVYAMVAGPWSLPGGGAAAWVVTWLWVVHSGLFAFLGLLFPDGRLPTVRWRYFAWTVVVVMVFGTVTAAITFVMSVTVRSGGESWTATLPLNSEVFAPRVAVAVSAVPSWSSVMTRMSSRSAWERIRCTSSWIPPMAGG